MLAFFAVVFILVGAAALAVSSTMFGQIAGLILWVIAALFLVGHAVIGAIEREARGLGKALAMHANAMGEQPTGGAGSAPPLSRPAQSAPVLVERATLWGSIADWWRRQ